MDRCSINQFILHQKILLWNRCWSLPHFLLKIACFFPENQTSRRSLLRLHSILFFPSRLHNNFQTTAVVPTRNKIFFPIKWLFVTRCDHLLPRLAAYSSVLRLHRQLQSKPTICVMTVFILCLLLLILFSPRLTSSSFSFPPPASLSCAIAITKRTQMRGW